MRARVEGSGDVAMAGHVARGARRSDRGARRFGTIAESLVSDLFGSQIPPTGYRQHIQYCMSMARTQNHVCIVESNAISVDLEFMLGGVDFLERACGKNSERSKPPV